VSVFTRNIEDALTVDALVTDTLVADESHLPTMDAPNSQPFIAGAQIFRDDQTSSFSKLYLPAKEPRFFGSYASNYSQNWQTAITLATASVNALGASVEELDTDSMFEIARELYEGPLVAERWSSLGEFVQTHPASTLPVTETILRSAINNAFSAVDLFKTQHKVAAVRQKTAELLRDAVLMLPTTGGTFTRLEVREDPIKTNSLLGLYTNHCNLCNLVAMAIPAPAIDSNVPFGVTFFSAAKNRCLAARAAAAFAAGLPGRVTSNLAD
jgi:allophanate hydrolase